MMLSRLHLQLGSVEWKNCPPLVMRTAADVLGLLTSGSMSPILIREILFAFLVLLQFSVAVYYRIKDSHSNRQITTGNKDRWLFIRNGLLIVIVVASFYSINTMLPKW